jgi:Fur family ferric uptake transcriptional regulator
MTNLKSSPAPKRDIAVSSRRTKTTRRPGRNDNAITRRCIDKGMRMTGQRKIIAGVLADCRDHPDIGSLHQRALKVDGRISLATVYRTISLFEKLGVIEKHSFGDGRARVEQLPEKHHDHLVDLKSGKVLEFRSEQIERLQAEIAARLGYRLVGHQLTLYGVPLNEK